MITRFDRYLLRTILITTLITLIFLLAVDFIIQVSADADDIGQGHYTLRVLLLQQLLLFPEKLILFMPAAVLVGTIMGLGQLTAQNEIAVVRAAGISRLRLARAGLILAFTIGILNILNGETLAPQLSDKSRLLHHLALGESSATQLKQGIWLKQHNTIIHIGALNPDGSLHDLRFYQPEADYITISEADSANYQAPDWLLENSHSYRTSVEKTETRTAPTRWENGATPQSLHSLAAIGSAETLRELYTLTRFMAANGLNHSQESLKLWQRLFIPLTTAAMVLLALPFAFGNTRSGQHGTRLVIGILLGVSYYVVSGVIANLALLLHWPPFLGAVLPIVVFSIPALILLRRQ
ncbi:MAG: LPS export ABC transporter permease LptG [Cardiobacteriaceae bacterium]|nr:LPS export ABC transporter permease LptG [Cardiobacteriaceae bacterium]